MNPIANRERIGKAPRPWPPLAAAGRVRSTSTKATICPQKDAYLVLTASAPIAVAGKVEVLVYAVAEGVAEVL